MSGRSFAHGLLHGGQQANRNAKPFGRPCLNFKETIVKTCRSVKTCRFQKCVRYFFVQLGKSKHAPIIVAEIDDLLHGKDILLLQQIQCRSVGAVGGRPIGATAHTLDAAGSALDEGDELLLVRPQLIVLVSRIVHHGEK